MNTQSAFTAMQNVIDKIVKLANAQMVLEFGCGEESTSQLLVKRNPGRKFHVIDMGDDPAKSYDYMSWPVNEDGVVKASVKDRKNISAFELCFMMCSLRYIPDTLKRKQEFLWGCYDYMRPGANLLIVDTFLPESDYEDDIEEMYDLRVDQCYADWFWSGINSLSPKCIRDTHVSAQMYKQNEDAIGNNVVNRDGEYPVKLSWLKRQAEYAGFRIVLCEPINCIGDYAILLEKIK